MRGKCLGGNTGDRIQERALHSLIRWFEELWNQGRLETIDELMDPDCVIHDGESDIRGMGE